MRDAVDILGLEAFIRIAECGSFRSAAEAMNLSQTALSHRIKKLEQDVGLSLIQRTTRSVTLTRAGQEFFPKARDMMLRLNELYQELKVEGRQARERVAIGCLSSLGERYLPRALRAFHDRHPGVNVVIYDDTANALCERVLAGEIQFALTIVGAKHWAQPAQVLFEEQFVAAVPAAHPLAGRSELQWADLVGYPLARIAATTSHGFILSESLNTFPHELDWRYEVQRTHMAGRLVIAGLAITVLPREAVPVHENVRIIPITGPSITRTVGIISQGGVPLSSHALLLQRLLLREVAAGVGSARNPQRAAPPAGNIATPQSPGMALG